MMNRPSRRAAALAAVTAVLTLGSLTAPAGASNHASDRSRSGTCPGPVSPYAASRMVLRACGDTIIPLRQVTPLSGGGDAYSYGSYTVLIPPAHFNVLKATDKQLAEFGFPTRKQLGAHWYPLMRHVRTFPRPTPYLVAASQRKANTNTISWAGYNVNGRSYNGVSAYWIEPHFVAANCSGDEFAQWTGIGGTHGSMTLGQDGTTFNLPGFAAHQGFIETVINDSGGPVAASVTATPGDQFYAQAFWDSQNNDFDYYMENVHTGATYSAHSRFVGNPDLSTAEVISERPQTSTGYTQLSDFQSVGVASATAYWGSGSSNGFYSLSHNSNTMVGVNGVLIADPGPIVAGSDFTTDWDRCQG